MISPAHPSTPLGLAIAAVLRTSWRAEPEAPASSLQERLPRVADILLDTGGGALGWWRIRDSPLGSSVAAERLHEAFRLHTLQAALHTKNLEHVLLHLNETGLVPIVFKGWTMARLYAKPALRPYGDVDILVAESDVDRARTLIARLSPELQEFVDLDMRVLRRFLPDRSYAELIARATTESLGAARLLTLAPEDHLRLICLHQLDHGGWRPLWLCDVAAFVESLPRSFRWDLCLAGNARLSDAVLALVGLAEELLGARIPADTPRGAVPHWFREAVLHGWAGGHQAPPDPLLGLHRLGWRRALQAVRARWPDPITSTLHLRAPFRGVPRVLLQFGELIRRGAVFIRKTWRNRFSELPSAVGSAAEQGVVS